MAFGCIKTTETAEDILKDINEFDLLEHYLGIKDLPCVIPSPLRKDNRPSFGLNTPDGIKVRYRDYATNDSGGIIDILMGMFKLSYTDTLTKIRTDLINNNFAADSSKDAHVTIKRNSDIHASIRCRIREWRGHDIKYWESYGITVEWLKWANVYPISLKFITKNNKTSVFGCPKYSYAFYEYKEGRQTVKIYQPYDKEHKWFNGHDSSVISLWAKVPGSAEKLIIASSLKDALCISCQLKIPAIAIQGEGYDMSDSAIKSLRNRYTNVYIALDSDKAGIENTKRLGKRTGFIEVYPDFGKNKDFSDYYMSLQDKEDFKALKKLFD